MMRHFWNLILLYLVISGAVFFFDIQQCLPWESDNYLGWSGMAKVSCILHHRGVKLILAYGWAGLAILVAGYLDLHLSIVDGFVQLTKSSTYIYLRKRECFFFFISSVSSLSFLFLFLHCPSLSTRLLSLPSFFSLSHGDDIKWPTWVDVSLNANTIN